MDSSLPFKKLKHLFLEVDRDEETIEIDQNEEVCQSPSSSSSLSSDDNMNTPEIQNLKRKKNRLDRDEETMEIDQNEEVCPSPSSSSLLSDENMNTPEIPNLKRKKNRLKLACPDNKFIELENAFRGILKTYYLKNNNFNLKDICLILQVSKEEMKKLVQNLLNEFEALKFNTIVECSYVKPLTKETQEIAFKTSNFAVVQGDSLNSI
ncbi:hypothetical protein J6590_043017 [Homalodisca vitripennis]|nr:hypothetical protein J6590_043017 [Homalodisca vitripennis]